MSFDEYETSYISIGPWGGQSGARWDDGVYSSVRQVVINHGAAIDSIQIEYEKRGFSVWSDKHGGSGGIKTDKVKFDYPDEYLVTISGHYGCVVDYGPVLVRSLMLESNKKSYGPFGIQQGNPFSFPMTGGKVVGFHGRSSWYLDSVGVYLKPLLQKNISNNFTASQNYTSNGISEKNEAYEVVIHGIETKDKVVVSTPQPGKGSPNPGQVVSYGPWGGNGGLLFDDGVYTGVREIHLTRYGGIVSIKVCYDLNTKAVWGNKNGGRGGLREEKISFDYPSEILTHITGYYGSTILRGPTVVKSLTFHTNKKKYGPFGDEQGISFTSGSNNGIIVGFHGRKGWFIDSIGVHVLEGKPQLSRLSFDSYNMSDMKTREVVPGSGMVKEVAPPALVQWGGEGGRPWDDGVFSGVKKIYLTKGEAIYSIQIEYDRNGQSVWSARHGGGSEGNSNMIKLDYPSEILTSVSGYYVSLTGDAGMKVIKSLTFYSNKAKYGPYGDEIGTYFPSTKTEGKIVGFHGRNNSYLIAIGVHMQPVSNDRDSTQQGLSERGGAVKTMINKFFS